MKRAAEEVLGFAPDFTRVVHSAPSPLPRAVLYGVVAIVLAGVAWANIGQLDVVAVSHGKLVPQSFLKIVQPAEGGVVREILVKEGEAVRAGQVLVRMDSSFSGVDTRMVEDELARRRLQLRRIDAELQGSPLAQTNDDPPELYAQVTAHLTARRQAHHDALGAEQALLARAEHDMASAAEIESKLRQTAPIYREQEKAWEQLAREGYAGRLLALDRQRSRIEADQELKAQSRNIESMKATIAQAEKRIAQIQSTYRQQLHSERLEAQAVYFKLQQEWQKQRLRHEWLELKAPEDGIVKDLATHTPGTVLAPGTIVLTLVPDHEPLLAQVWVSNSDAGFVQRGQKARIKIAAYPFPKYGLIDGTVVQVGADAQDKVAAADGTVKNLSELAYRALVSLEPPGLSLNGERLRLAPGMVVTAEMHIGRRTVMEYVLSPLQKIGAEAARER